MDSLNHSVVGRAITDAPAGPDNLDRLFRGMDGRRDIPLLFKSPLLNLKFIP
jgi:hypothetical protein